MSVFRDSFRPSSRAPCHDGSSLRCSHKHDVTISSRPSASMSYCGTCDKGQKFIFTFPGDRPISRATHLMTCVSCRQKHKSRRQESIEKGIPITAWRKVPYAFPACEYHSRNGPCDTCHQRAVISSLLPDKDLDTESEDDEDEVEDEDKGEDENEVIIKVNRNENDVRTDPPRFTACSRTKAKVPHVWSEEPVQKWYLSILRDCTGCGKQGPLMRWCFDVVIKYQGNPITQRYRHKLCRRCAVCAVTREQSMNAAKDRDLDIWFIRSTPEARQDPPLPNAAEDPRDPRIVISPGGWHPANATTCRPFAADFVQTRPSPHRLHHLHGA